MDDQHMNCSAGPAPACLRLPAGLGLPALRRGLAGHYTLRATRPVKHDYVFYDTFEWNLWFAGRLLYRIDGVVELAARGPGWPGAVEARGNAGGTLPRLAGDWAPSPLREVLAPLSGLRALMPLAEVAAAEQTIDLLDQGQKVVFRFDLVGLFAPGRPRTPFYRLYRPRPLRGYDQEAAAADQLLRALGLADIEAGPLEETLARRGHSPAPHSLRPAFDLTPDEPAREAVRQIVRRMLTIARRQEPGIIDDIDTEFLHDYRICLRKVRSILTLLKDVYPPRDTARLKRVCGDLTRATNRLRDLDVSFLDRDAYRKLLPDELQGGLDPLFQALEAERRREFRRIRRHLQSAAYRKRIAALETFFTEPDRLPPSPNSAEPILPLVSRRILRDYRRIFREGRSVNRQTPDAVMHAIRIQGKKLRYLLEFFGELFDPEELGYLLKQLRRLQNRLGRFNDCAVQQKSLLAHWQALHASAPADAALSVGGLVALLNLQQQRQRHRAGKALARFRAPDLRKRFRTLFAPRLPAPP